MFDEFYGQIDYAPSGFTIQLNSSESFRSWMGSYGNFLELFILSLSALDVSAICMMFYVFSKSPQFHWHLIALIRLLFVSFIGYTAFRNIVIILTVCTPNAPVSSKTLIPINLMFLEHLKIAFGTAYMMAMLSFVAERCLATIFLDNYEKQRWPVFIVVNYLFQIFGSFLIVLAVFWKPKLTIIFVSLGGVLAASQVLSFVIINRINQRRYKESTTIGNCYTLSQRFQLSENIRSSKLLKWSIFYSAFCNSLELTLFALYWSVSDPGYKRVFKISYELFVTIYALILVYIALQACDIWKRTFLNLLGVFRARVLPISYSISASSTPNYHNFVRTSKGEQMIFSVAQESELYFQQLRSTWS